MVDAQVVESLLADLALHGAVGETGVSRLVYSPEWVAAQDQVAAWYADAGLRVERDAAGNVWGFLDGGEPGKAIVTGSHIDSQKPGGRYDGALGVVAGLLALRELRERHGRPRRTLAAVSLTEEEASRFARTNFWGSRAIAGAIAPGEAERMRAIDGPTMAEVMRNVGLDAARLPEAKRDDIAAFIELHIEQGPILEAAGIPVGVVERITGYRQHWIELRGQANHAGTTPMDLRRDPMAGAAEIIGGVIATAQRMGRPAVTTVGRMVVEPNGRAVVPERVAFTVDARHPDPAALALLLERHEGLWTEVARRRDLDLHVRVDSDRAPVVSDPDLVASLLAAAADAGVPAMPMTSGAVHDAMQFAAICPVAMLFVPSQGGISHSPLEYTDPAAAAAGIDVLTGALRRLAY
ncbi:MAG TPA: Zn-dependent hydrolase [Thermomicrobiales bacterium]|nr:Zn-dependent hydrolase [Thermomicrobiales bacterium]